MIDIQNTILGKIVDRKHEELATRLKQRSYKMLNSGQKKQHLSWFCQGFTANVQP
jgi:hypothetical protein